MTQKTGRFADKRQYMFIAVALLFVAAGVGIFVLIISYRMSLIPSMTFEEMLAYTTEGNDKALVTVGIIKDGEMNFTVYGESAALLPSEEYIYEIGSVTKTFTTSLLSKALSDGRVKLQDTIDEYIALGGQGDLYPTLEALATHTAGYKNYYFEWPMIANFLKREGNDFYNIDAKMLIDRIGRTSIADSPHNFLYSNFGIAVVGSVLSKLYGEEFTTVMNDYIATDLRLEQTRINDGTGDLDGYWRWQPNDAYLPAGGLISTIGDMLDYLALHMSNEIPYLSHTHEAHAEVNATTRQYEQMGIRIDAVGLGWMIDEENNIVWHNGATSNFNSYIAFDKETGVGVVILSNLSPNYRIPATVLGPRLMKDLQNPDH